MSEDQPNRELTSEELMRFYERILKMPYGRCISVHDLVPIFEVENIHPGPKS